MTTTWSWWESKPAAKGSIPPTMQPGWQAPTEALAAVEVALLVDEQTLQPVENGLFEVTGVNFHWQDARGHFNQVLQQLAPPTPDAFPLLLAHDPRLGRWVPEDRFQLVLSGHTHGGQVACNMFGLPVSVLRLFGVRDQGWFTTGRTRHHVHRGNWLIGLPPRMGVAGEIALFLPEPPAG